MTPGPKPDDRNKTDAEFTEHLITAILVRYPNGIMPVDSIMVVFGMTMAAAMSSFPRADRKRAAEAISKWIIDPPTALQMPTESRKKH